MSHARLTAVDGGVVTVDLPGGGKLRARGRGILGARVYVCDGVIQGLAPNLPLDSSELP